MGRALRFWIVGWAKARKRRAHASLAEVASYLANVATPINRQYSTLDLTMEAAVRPVAHPRNQSMLHGIVVDVVDVALEISFVCELRVPNGAATIFLFLSWRLCSANEPQHWGGFAKSHP